MKTRKNYHLSKKTRKMQRGGENIDVKHVMLNKAMRAALKKEKTERFPDDESFLKTGFYPLARSLNTGVGCLERLEEMKKLTKEQFNKLLTNNPPKLKKRAIIKTTGVELYEVIDGRHRVVRAILNGKNTIPFVTE